MWAGLSTGNNCSFRSIEREGKLLSAMSNRIQDEGPRSDECRCDARNSLGVIKGASVAHLANSFLEVFQGGLRLLQFRRLLVEFRSQFRGLFTPILVGVVVQRARVSAQTGSNAVTFT